jgi:nucleotide-binding universal stress UspA family protein
MKLLVTAAGPKPAQDKAGYVVNFAKRIGADIIALYISQQEADTNADTTLNVFTDAGQAAGVKVIREQKQGEVVNSIVQAAKDASADLIIMGASPGNDAGKWLSTRVMEKVAIPVIVFPLEFKKIW